MDIDKLTKAFTLVFAGDIRQFKMNPLTTETPWGIPYAVSVGDVLEELDELKEKTDGRPCVDQKS
jgi:hypothetical protein